MALASVLNWLNVCLFIVHLCIWQHLIIKVLLNDSGTCEFELMTVLNEVIFHNLILYVHFIFKGNFRKEASTC